MLSNAHAKIRLARSRPQIIVTVLAVALSIWGVMQMLSNRPTLRLGTATYTVTIADDDIERQKGLSGHTTLSSNEAMLFVFDRADRHCFWMKDMSLTIDMIWLDSERRVVHVQPRVAPETYPEVFCPPVPAQYGIEVTAGQAAASQVKQGSRATF